MMNFSPTCCFAVAAIRRCTRPLLAVPLCLLLMSCDSASSSNNKTTQTAPIDSLEQIDGQSDAAQENDSSDVVNEANGEQGQSLIAAANTKDNTRSSPMISTVNSDSTLQATLMGDYGGIVPCASCDSIDITLNLFADGSVLKTSVFNDAEPTNPPLLESGVYRQDDNKITIVYEKKNIETYQIRDNHLIMMDIDKNPNDDYTLSRR